MPDDLFSLFGEIKILSSLNMFLDILRLPPIKLHLGLPWLRAKTAWREVFVTSQSSLMAFRLIFPRGVEQRRWLDNVIGGLSAYPEALIVRKKCGTEKS